MTFAELHQHGVQRGRLGQLSPFLFGAAASPVKIRTFADDLED